MRSPYDLHRVHAEIRVQSRPALGRERHRTVDIVTVDHAIRNDSSIAVGHRRRPAFAVDHRRRSVFAVFLDAIRGHVIE